MGGQINDARPVVRVVIGVPTYHRLDDLRDLIGHLQKQMSEVSDEPRWQIETVIIDNDPAGGARATVEAITDPHVRYVNEVHPGLSAVRNRALDEAADADLLVMMDDDERPESGWLRALLHTWRDTSASAVAGRVIAEFDGELDPWIAAGQFFVRRNMPTGTPITVSAFGNILLDLRQIRPTGIRFDERFRFAGGEDTMFTSTLHARGLTMAWCAESIVIDRVPKERMTRAWVLKRAWSHGNVATLVDLERARGSASRAKVRLTRSVGGLLRVVAGFLRYLSGLALRSDRHQARGLRASFRGAGMVAGALGHAHQAYGRT